MSVLGFFVVFRPEIPAVGQSLSAEDRTGGEVNNWEPAIRITMDLVSPGEDQNRNRKHTDRREVTNRGKIKFLFAGSATLEFSANSWFSLSILNCYAERVLVRNIFCSVKIASSQKNMVYKYKGLCGRRGVNLLRATTIHTEICKLGKFDENVWVLTKMREELNFRSLAAS